MTALPNADCGVAVVGAGPAGLAAAIELKRQGVDDVIVLEREPVAGGVPRHCGHIPFGLREYRRCLTGPRYAARLAAEARRAGVAIWTGTSVVRLDPGGRLLLSGPGGSGELRARRVILATGARETPRSARLVGGQRPLGVVTTGALQSLVYLNREAPFRRPVIVGTELVSFSALLTCRHAGIAPAAMLEANPRITVAKASRLLPLALGVPLLTATTLVEIIGDGRDRVCAVTVADRHGQTRRLDCDGVVFSGCFVPEAALLALGHIRLDSGSGGPVVDQYGRCSDPCYFAAGNLLRPIESAGWSWQEGRQTAAAVAASLRERLPAPDADSIPITRDGAAIKYVVPQRLVLPHAAPGMAHLQLRFNRPLRGRLRVSAGARALWSKSVRGLPERRALIPLAALAAARRGRAPLCVTVDVASEG